MAGQNISALLTIRGAVDSSFGSAASRVRKEIDSLGTSLREQNAAQRNIGAYPEDSSFGPAASRVRKEIDSLGTSLCEQNATQRSIGTYLEDSSFGPAASRVRKEIDSLGTSLCEQNATQRNIGTYSEASSKVDTSRAALHDQMRKQVDLQKQSVTSNTPEEQARLNDALTRQKLRVASARTALEKHIVTLDKQRESLRAAGIDTSNLSAENERLARANETASKRLLEFKTAAKSVRVNTVALSAQWGNLKGSSLSAAAAISGVGCSFKRVVFDTSAFGTKARETAQSLGVSSQQLLQWQYIGENAGVKAEKFSSALFTLNEKIKAAKDGTKASSQAFEELNLDPATLGMMDLTTRLKVISAAYKSYNGEMSKSTIVTKLFGADAYKMGNILSMSAEEQKKWTEQAAKNGYALDDSQGKIVEAFEDSLGAVKASIIGVRNQIGLVFLPVVTRAMNFIAEHTGIVKAGFAVMATVITGKAVIALTKFGVEAGKTFKSLKQLAVSKAILSALSLGGTGEGVAATGAGIFRMLGPMLKGLIPAVTTFATGALPALAAAFSAVGTAIMTTPVGWIAAAIAGAAILIIKFWQPIKAFFVGIWEGIKEGFAPIMPSFLTLGTAVKRVGSFFASLFKPIQFSTGALKKCSEAGRMVGKVLLYTLFPVLIPIRAIMWGVQALRKVFGDSGASGALAMRRLKTAMWLVAPGIGLLIMGVRAIISAWEPLKAFFVGVCQGIVNAFAPVYDAISECIGLMNDTGAVLARAFEPAIATVLPALDWLWTAFSNVGHFIEGMFAPFKAGTESLATLGNAGVIFGDVIIKALVPVLSVFKGLAGAIHGMRVWLKGENEVAADAPGQALAHATSASMGGRAAVEVAKESVRGNRSVNMQQTNQTTVQVVSQPGQSSEDIAQKVADEIERRQNSADRAALFDDPSLALAF